MTAATSRPWIDVRRAGVIPVVLALGSNIEPARHLVAAVRRLRERLHVTAVSQLYETVPVGAAGSPIFLNAAVLLETSLAPAALKLDVLRPLESEAGRVRGEDRNAPRTLDLDILLYGALILRDPGHGLTIPDPDLPRFAHLALPAADVAPDLCHPETGQTLAALAARFRGAPGVRVVGPEEVPWPPGLTGE